MAYTKERDLSKHFNVSTQPLSQCIAHDRGFLGSQGTRSAGFQSVSRDVIQTADGVRISLVKGSISELQVMITLWSEFDEVLFIL